MPLCNNQLLVPREAFLKLMWVPTRYQSLAFWLSVLLLSDFDIEALKSQIQR